MLPLQVDVQKLCNDPGRLAAHEMHRLAQNLTGNLVCW